MLRLLFPASLILSAVLLFSVQPMIAKTLLPFYGGTPAVWTICMLFFQLVLLASYGYAWGLSHAQKPKLWRGIHFFLMGLSVLFFPFVFHPGVAGHVPEWSILSDVLRQMGLPVFILGASAPLLQFAYSQTKNKGAADPYFLYSASNLGSLLSLLLYPWVVERFIGLKRQYELWGWGFLLYLILLTILFLFFRYKPLKKTGDSEGSWCWSEIAMWVFLSFIPCSLMLGVTLYITTDVAATPLFWVLPLALYLLTFVISFSEKPILSNQWVTRNCFFFLLFPMVGFILGVNQVRAWQTVLFHLVSFFMLALLCHSQLYLRRPKAHRLTLFYFSLAFGGVLAGLFNGILAPHLFSQIYEYPIAIALSLLVLPLENSLKQWWLPVLILGVLVVQYSLPAIQWPLGLTTFQMAGLMSLLFMVLCRQTRWSLFLSCSICLMFIFSPYLQQNNVLLQARNFYGVKQIVDKQGVHVLISQSTVHGLQPVGEKKPISGFRSYYGALQHVVELMQRKYSSMSIAIMGLGAGTMVCQHRETDHLTVIEIDDQMIQLAKKPSLFTFLRDCPVKTHVIKNDGRLAIEKLPDASQHLLILDAFNSDAIPVHLMTLEAFRLYKKKLISGGVILVNVSNRHLDMMPVLNAIGHALDDMVFYLAHAGNSQLGQFNSEWALLTTNQDFAFKLMNNTGWQFVADARQILWTDDYSNIVPLLRW